MNDPTGDDRRSTRSPQRESVGNSLRRRQLRPDGQGDDRSFRFAFARQKDVVLHLIESGGLKFVCEVGGGQNPLLDPDEIRGLGLEYTLLDISERELAQAPSLYHKVRSDICKPLDSDEGIRYDLVFSRMLAEHVQDARLMHENIFRLLRPGGYAFHFFPTMYSPAFVMNRLLPERAAEWALDRALRGRRDRGKFPARYSWCRAESPRNVRRLQEIGYRVVEYRSFYGTEYLRRVPIAAGLERRFHQVAERRDSRVFTSFVWLILQRPNPPAGG